MPAPGGNLSDPGEIFDLYRCRSLSGSTVAYLAIGVRSPGPDRAVTPYGKRMIPSGTDGSDCDKAAGLDRGGPGRGTPVPQLTIIVVSPGPHGAVGFQGNTMIEAGGDGGDLGQSGHLHG